MATVGRAKYTRARKGEEMRGEETRREGSAEKTIFGAPFASHLLELSRARVYFARHTIAIAKIRDYSQSRVSWFHLMGLSLSKNSRRRVESTLIRTYFRAS